MKFYNIMRASISITVEYHYATKRIQMIIELLVSFVGERFFYSSFKLISLAFFIRPLNVETLEVWTVLDNITKG